MHKVLFLLLLPFAVYGSAIPDFHNLENSRDAVFFLSTTRSGSNVISASLSIITRKPISWLSWGNEVFAPNSKLQKHISYNRLNLPLISDIPLLYRSHEEFSELMQIPSQWNKLIFVTRNPKELLFRSFFLTSPSTATPDQQFIQEFLDTYLKSFEVYCAWHAENRVIVFYEDFIAEGDKVLSNLLRFMGEEPIYLDDFMEHKQEYMSRLFESYKKQHWRNAGGASSMGGPKAIHYTKNVSPEVLREIDRYLEEKNPFVWRQYLKRFEIL